MSPLEPSPNSPLKHSAINKIQMGKKSRAARYNKMINDCKTLSVVATEPATAPAPVSTPDVFNNAAADIAIKQLTPEQREHYRQIGEALYGRVDFPDAKILDNMPPPMAECAAYIADGLKSGLLPSELSEDEERVAIEAWGDEWWNVFGFTKEEALRNKTK